MTADDLSASHPPTTWFTVTLPITSWVTVEVAATSPESAVDVAKMKVIGSRRTLLNKPVNATMAVEIDAETVSDSWFAFVHDREFDITYEYDLEEQDDE